MTARMSALTHEIELLKSGPKDRYSWSYLLIIGIVFLVLVTLTVTAARSFGPMPVIIARVSLKTL